MEFPGNSHNPTGPNPPKEEKHIEKVVAGEVVQRKTPLGRRFKNLFFGGEFKGAMKYLSNDVLLPALRNMLVDTTTKGVERVVYGESYSRRRPEIGRPRVSYDRLSAPSDRYGSRRAMLPDQPPFASSRRKQDVGEIILNSRDDAEIVAERLADIIDKYDVASVADFHELVGLPSSYVDNKWGWSSMKGVDIRQIREGYLLDLPPVEPLGN
jgi:hypothetical protein